MFLTRIISEVTSNAPSIQIPSFPTAIIASQYVRGKPEDQRLRRLARYSASEQALAKSFQRCGIQQPPEELHLEALKKSTSILEALAVDARDAVDRLRALLANRSAEPTLYRSLQRQRWMEERRHGAFDQLSKTLRTELTRFSSSTTNGQTLTLESSNAKSNTNLVKFFEPSRRRTPIRSHPRRRPPKPRDEQPDDSHIDLPRSHHENHIIPLVLKAPQQRRFFPSHAPQSQSQSLQDHSVSSSSVENVSSAPSTISDTSHLETITEDNETILHISPPANYNQDETDGTALIWRDAPRSKEDILADFDVSMPDYVADLLAGLESPSRPGPITLPTHTSFILDTSPPPPIPREPIQKSSSRSRLSTLFSGIPETFTLRLTNTNGSDTTKASRVRLAVQPTIDSIIEGPSQPFAIMDFSDLNPGNSGSQASNTEEEKMIVRIRRRISTLARTWNVFLAMHLVLFFFCWYSFAIPNSITTPNIID